LQDFGKWNNQWNGYHLGEDVGREDADIKKYTVYPMADGVVKFADVVMGYTVIIEHKLSDNDPDGDSVCSVYYHMKRPGEGGIKLNFGEAVSMDSPIGYVSGKWEDHESSPHLHFGIRKGRYIPETDKDSRTGFWYYTGYTVIKKDGEVQKNPNDPIHKQILADWFNPSTDPKNGTGFIEKHIAKFEVQIIEVSSSKDYFPLDEGRRWEYQFLLKKGGGLYTGLESEISGEEIITNFPQRELEGKRVTPQQVNYILWGSSRTIFWFYIEDQSGVYEFAHQKAGQIEPEIAYDIIIKYPIKIGNSWQETETSAFKPEISVPVESTIESINEIVTVPAGNFEDCLKIKTIGFAEKVTGEWLGEEERVRIDIESYKWFAPGIGEIKMIFKEKKTRTGGIISFTLPPEFREVTIQLETFK
jgi:hypothetical protein